MSLLFITHALAHNGIDDGDGPVDAVRLENPWPLVIFILLIGAVGLYFLLKKSKSATSDTKGGDQQQNHG